MIFRFPEESIFVYWNPELLEKQAEEDNWKAPFTTDEYEARMEGDTWIVTIGGDEVYKAPLALIAGG